jgi:hypothetical protein
VRLLLEGLDRTRFAPTAAVSPLEDPAFPAALEALGARVVPVEIARDPSPVKDLRAFRAIRDLVRSGEFDLVHAHASKPGAFARLAAARDRVPVVYTPHGWYLRIRRLGGEAGPHLRAERRLGAMGGFLHCVSEGRRRRRCARDRPGGADPRRAQRRPGPPPRDPARIDALRRSSEYHPGILSP